MSDRLAVILPGIGYHKDKPLLYYAGKLAAHAGYEILHIAYHDMPQKVRGNAEMMRQAAELAFAQTAEQLADTDFAAYDSVLLIGKSLGTVAAARYAAAYVPDAVQIWYTPVEATFAASDAKHVTAFLGDADPWSDIARLKAAAAARGIPLHLYPDCNHSLECGDTDRDLAILRDVMQHTARVIAEV